MELLQVSIVLGVTLGFVYALAGVGLVVIFRTSGYVSFAQGDIAAVALYLGLAAYAVGLPYPLTFLMVLALGAIVGGVMWLGVRFFERSGGTTAAMASLGFGLILQGIETSTRGTDPRAFPSSGDREMFTIGGVALKQSDVITCAAAVVVFCLLAWMFKRTSVGLSMRAAHDSPEGALHVGVRASTVRAISWVVAGTLAALVGLFVAPTYSLTPSSVSTLLVFGFLTVSMGGFDSVLGALVAGILLGVTANLVAAYISPQLESAAAYVLLLCVLVLRPQGLFGRRRLERV